MQDDRSTAIQSQTSQQPYAPPSRLSLRELPLSTVHEAIRSPSDDAQTMLRADQCLALYFQPDEDAKTKLAVRQAFATALETVPQWAMHKAFDEWIRTGTRRPSPAEIRLLADRAIDPFYREAESRRNEQERVEAEKREAQISPEDMARRREAAARIMAEAGYLKSHHFKERGPVREGVTPEEIAETMAEVNARSADREAEAARREAVARELAERGLGDGVKVK